MSQDRLHQLFIPSIAAVSGDFSAFPLDTLKVRMQICPNRSSAPQMSRILYAEGVGAIYKGVGASAFRQFTYGGLRLSLYEPIRNIASSALNESSPSLLSQLLAGAIAGGVSSAVMCPTDVVKLRLQANVGHYSGSFDVISSILRTEGTLKLWRGLIPTSTRAALVASAELGVYDFSKTTLLSFGFQDTPGIYLTSSILATLSAIGVSFPVDVAKTRMINQAIRGSASQYSGMVSCIVATAKERGVVRLYQGVMPSLGRQMICNAVTFQVYEHLKKWL